VSQVLDFLTDPEIGMTLVMELIPGDSMHVVLWREKKLPVFVARLFNTVGPRQTGRYGMVLPRFVEAALHDEPITIHGDGKQTRCFCHVTDVVRALVALPNQPRAVGQVYNIGSTEEVSMMELAQRVKRMTESQSALRLIPYDQAYAKGFEDMRRRVPSTDKLYQLMGWRPTKSLDEILRLMIDFQRGLDAQVVRRQRN